MPSVHLSIEDGGNAVSDPYDWNVEEVVSALCDPSSRLRTSHGSRSFPNETFLAAKLREHDVTGLALLQNVDAECLKKEFGIGSMGQRACLEELVEALQQESLKYQQRQIRRSSSYAARSSVGWRGRVETPYLSTLCEAGAPPGDPGPWKSPRGILSGWYDPSPTWEHGMISHERIDNRSRDMTRQAPALPQPDWPTPQASVVAEDPHPLGSDDDKRENSLPDSRIEGDRGPNTLHANILASGSSDSDLISRVRCIETSIIDESGRKRRRLAPTVISTATSAKSAPGVTAENGASIAMPHQVMHEHASVDKRSLLNNLDTVLKIHSNELDATLNVLTEPKGCLPILPIPGKVHTNEQGRKRVMPILQSASMVDLEPRPNTPIHDEDIGTEFYPQVPGPKVVDTPSTREISFGKKAQRNVDQIYLGFDCLGVDELFYGETELEHTLDEKSSVRSSNQQDIDTFTLVSPDIHSTAQKLYVHSRMKFFLQTPRHLIGSEQGQRIGIVPYPSRIARKYHPLSMTIYQRVTTGAILALRSNRSKWIEGASVRKLAADDDRQPPNVFNIADPALAMDDNDDIEWKALEKWKYLEGDDQVLPIYGESSSEGEYDLDTWKEMEQEAGELERMEGRSRKPMMTREDVQTVIDAAIERIVEDWKGKARPRLQTKAWRIWMRANRDKSRDVQVQRIEVALTSLRTRIDKLRDEIAKEEWSKSSKVTHQCKILQPSLFDLEALKWEKQVLQLRKAPEKVASLLKQRKPHPDLPIEQPLLEDGEEDIVIDSHDYTSSAGSLEDFIADDENASGVVELISLKDDQTMADVEDEIDGMASDTLILLSGQDESTKVGQSSPQPCSVALDTPHTGWEAIFSKSHIIDLTQASSDVESFTVLPKTERTFEIKTPPINSGSDTDFFSRASRNGKPVFKRPTPPSQGQSNIIDLDTTSEDEVATTGLLDEKPAHSNIVAIKQMDPSIFLEQQDRKRLLVWIIAHTPSRQRNLAMKCLIKFSMEILQRDVLDALKGLIAHRQRLRRLEGDHERSESILQIAAWFVSWSMVVKYSASGLAKEHVAATVEDIDGFEDFFDFLLLSLRPYETPYDPPTPPNIATPQKQKKQRIVREDTGVNTQNTPFRKRVYAIPISQETLNKTQSAMQRQLADEHRRKEQLELRRAGMQAGRGDATEVIINPGKLKDQQYIRLDPRFGGGAHLKPHQEEGLQFLWREITADHDDLQGCLLAQTMGLGKTIQVIALLVALSQAGKSPNSGVREQVPPSLRQSHTLILCPPALVENWWDELHLWVPALSDSIGIVHKISAAMKLEDRVSEILVWNQDGGILILGYAAFRRLISNKGRKSKSGHLVPPPLDEKIHQSVRTALLDGSRLVVADEAHEFKNAQSTLSSVMNQIKTKSRVALTGSPLANNLGEYYTLIDWVAPRYLGTPSEFRATYQEDIDAGLYRDSTDYQYREARKRLKALELVMGPKVHRADVSALHSSLHGKLEFVIKVSLTPLQDQLYRVFVESTLHASAKDEPHRAVLWTWLHILQLLCNHPKLFKDKLQSLEAVLEATPGAKRPAKRKIATNSLEDNVTTSDDDDDIITELGSQGALGRILTGARSIFDKNTDPIDNKSLSNKMQVLMTIIEHCGRAGNKMLIFSHRIPTLDYVADKLRGLRIQFERIDGTVDPQKRQAVTKSFNEKSLNICLISTRAGGQGLNLFGANRVVILDDWFNPMWEQQAIGRAYRIGQQKSVYVYRLTTAGTFEEAIQNQSLFKEQLATRVVDKRNPIRSAKRGAGQYLFLPKKLEPEDLRPLNGKDPLVLDHLLADRENTSILSIVPSETFQVDDGVELTPEEKREVEQMQKDEELRRRDPVQYSAIIMQRKVKYTQDQLKAVEAPSAPLSTTLNGLPSDGCLRWQPSAIQGQITPPLSTASVVHNGPSSCVDALDGLVNSKGNNTSHSPRNDCMMKPETERDTSPRPCTSAKPNEAPVDNISQRAMLALHSSSKTKSTAPTGQGEKEGHTPDSKFEKEYNWKTPHRGNKRSLLSEDDPIVINLPSKKHKPSHSSIKAGFKSTGLMETQFDKLLENEAARNGVKRPSSD